MKKIYYIASVLMTIIFVGCSKDSLEQGNNIIPDNEQVTKQESPASGETITFTASAVTKSNEVTDESGSRRVAYGATDATWEAGDKIFLVKSDGTTITLTLSGGEGTTAGTFTSTDAVTAGTYTPYAVSATALTKGYVSISSGVITLDLSAGGGGSLADALEHDILKGDNIVLTDDQENATITGLSTHILSVIRFQFVATEKAITNIGISSTGGINQTVTIATNGTVTGSNPTTNVITVGASSIGSNTYSGYFAVYGSTTTSLLAHAEDVSTAKYTRLVSTKTANYTAGTVYGKTFTLSSAMMNAAATGTLSSQSWKNLGLSVKWAGLSVGASSETQYMYNIDNGTSNEAGIAVPAGWSGWRLPTRAEAQELFYASNRQWITGATNGVRFNCNDNYVTMGAGGYWRMRDDQYTDDAYSVGSALFYINENTPSNGWYAQLWAIVSSEGTALSFGSANLGTYVHSFTNYAPMRLVCDY